MNLTVVPSNTKTSTAEPQKRQKHTIRPLRRGRASPTELSEGGSNSHLTRFRLKLTKQFTCGLCAAAVSLLLGLIGRWSGREFARSALSLARSAQAERDNESCFFLKCWRPLAWSGFRDEKKDRAGRDREQRDTEIDSF
ncbi:hypothetical protein EVAR_12598_1 [Eumeta japonica]|uniref:Uncharacterized protein n=1 Tax=Eumeta variegata TaxID=151549 RepID=A0A4C1UEP9_EUMVA|nr:hypothetical protein EVAR_12598_1 [Eumeta japonica]